MVYALLAKLSKTTKEPVFVIQLYASCSQSKYNGCGTALNFYAFLIGILLLFFVDGYEGMAIRKMFSVETNILSPNLRDQGKFKNWSGDVFAFQLKCVKRQEVRLSNSNFVPGIMCKNVKTMKTD